MKGRIEPGAFITAESRDGEYRVIIKCSSMKAMHEAHRAVLEQVYEVNQPEIEPDPIRSKAWLAKLNRWIDLLGEVKKESVPRYMRDQIQSMRNGLRGYRDHGWKYEASKEDES